MFKTILLAVGLLGVAIAAIAIKMFVKKGGEFKKQCGSIDPTTGQKISCSCSQEGNSCHNA